LAQQNFLGKVIRKLFSAQVKIDFRPNISYKILILMKNDKSGSGEFEVILDKFSASIKASIRRFGLERSGIDPEDVFQEVRIKLWKKFAHEKNISHQASYINRVVNSALIDQIRKARRQEKLIYHEKQKWLVEEQGRPDASAQDSVFREMIFEAADSLMESRRKVVKLFLSGLTMDEISLTLNWSKDKTRNLLYRGLSDLKRKLKDRGIEYEDR
jgi:RNA polymerase sigma factor (sigma-70 family)